MTEEKLLLPCFICKKYCLADTMEEYEIKGLLFKKYICKQCIKEIKNPESVEQKSDVNKLEGY